MDSDDAAVELRGSGQGHEREMLATVGVAHFELDSGTRPPANESVRASARSSARPARARLKSWSATRWPSSEVELVGGSCAERFMRAVAVVPAAPQRQFPYEVGAPERDQHELPRAFGLER